MKLKINLLIVFRFSLPFLDISFLYSSFFIFEAYRGMKKKKQKTVFYFELRCRWLQIGSALDKCAKNTLLKYVINTETGELS